MDVYCKFCQVKIVPSQSSFDFNIYACNYLQSHSYRIIIEKDGKTSRETYTCGNVYLSNYYYKNQSQIIINNISTIYKKSINISFNSEKSFIEKIEKLIAIF